MKQLISLLGLLFFALYSSGQSSDNFKTFAKKQRLLMLKDYSRNDLAGYRRHIGEFLTAYEKLDEKGKRVYNFDKYEAYYLLGCAYAHAGDKKNAVDCIVKSGEDDYDGLLHDHDLDNLRKEPAFIKFLNDVKERQDSHSMLATLQKAPKYNSGENDNLPLFTYQAADNPNLAALKKAFNLDSIAGQGTDVTKIINLMEWAHYLVVHDGSKGNPETKNAMRLIAECTQNHKTLNCRGLAILLNEAYLAQGFASRFVTCLPKDTTDQDCHVITSVWAPSLHKWVWMDPTFMAYVMDENGTLLSIEEVRERLISSKPLILNPDANHNRNEIQTKSNYLDYYMAKNLYKLECPASSEYNYETPADGKTRTYIQLMPGEKIPSSRSYTNKHGVATFTTYYTANQKNFWRPPANIGAIPDSKNKADYEAVMEKFKNYYNHRMADSMDNILYHEKGQHCFLSAERLEDLYKEYGAVKSFKFLGMEEDNANVAIFKIACDNSEHAMGISLDENNVIGTFRFDTRSPSIDKLLAKEM